MEVANIFAQVSHQRSFRESEEIDPRPDLEAAAEISQKVKCDTEMSQLNKLLRHKCTRVYQGCSGRSIKTDEGNPYSDRFLREGTNAISFLQVIQTKDELETTEAESEELRILTSSLGRPWKVLGTVWKPTPTILIVVRTQPESSVNT